MADSIKKVFLIGLHQLIEIAARQKATCYFHIENVILAYPNLMGGLGEGNGDPGMGMVHKLHT